MKNLLDETTTWSVPFALYVERQGSFQPFNNAADHPPCKAVLKTPYYFNRGLGSQPISVVGNEFNL